MLTYESPIEFVYDMIKAPSSIISQSEIPRHLPDVAACVRNDLRRKPRLILVGEARDKGDLSENAEYEAAKEAQGLLELKISKLEEILGNSRVIDPSKLDISKVGILSKVRVLNKKVNKEVTYTIVAEKEADLKKGKISIQSPIGKGLMGKKVGEVADVTVPAGVIPFEILEITV